MEIQPVEHLLAKNAANPLSLKRLKALEPRLEPYFVSLCQPGGVIHASAARIGNSDQAAALAMYTAFLASTIEHQSQLVATPEYSVPWTIMESIAFGDLRPPQGGIWALGFESITPGELEALGAGINAHSNLRLLHEDFDVQQRAQKRFIDPLVYIFWSTDQDGSDVLCFVVQFKTVVSGDEEHVELKSLYLGSRVYKFTRPGDISLIGIICSDAFEFSNEIVAEHHDKLLLLHLQLNPRPGHIDYAAYRLRLYATASDSDVEIFCLNWSANVLVEGETKPLNSISGSAWYVAPQNVKVTDDDVNVLHHNGIYYSIVADRWHGFYFNYAPHSLLLRKRPVFSNGVQALVKKIVPEVLERRMWDSQAGNWVAASAKDGFEAFIGGYNALAGSLPQMCSQNPLAVERALELLEGPVGTFSDWYSVKELRSLRVADEESIRRVTVSQETDPGRSGVMLRRERVRRAQTAATLPSIVASWPPGVTDLATGFKYRWTRTDPHSNVEPSTGEGLPAALVYLGEDPEQDSVSNTYSKLTKARRVYAVEAAAHGTNLADLICRAEDRLCVVFKQNHEVKFHRPEARLSITDPKIMTDDIAGDAK